jgi:hypothetical protein
MVVETNYSRYEPMSAFGGVRMSSRYLGYAVVMFNRVLIVTSSPGVVAGSSLRSGLCGAFGFLYAEQRYVCTMYSMQG